MKLQLALDGELEPSLRILRAAHAHIDIAEIGTPLVYREGVAAVRRFRAEFPDLMLLADFKIMDAGDEEAAIAFDAGSDLVTVLGVTQDATLQGALTAAKRSGKQIMIDLMGVPDLQARAETLLAMGCHYLCIHTAYDLQTAHAASPLEHLQNLRRQLPNAPLAVAGGIKLESLDPV